ncbi:MAG TPA: pilus assembly protein TadG-related protein [Roseiarcus sp.]|nr:pilus assembly protein TadG-related protein [Roseiarcus sp.]
MRIDPFRRFARDRRGNVAMYYGLMAVPLIFAIGMGVDYANNARKWTQLNAAADAAALAAVTPTMMQQSDAVAKTAATDMFEGQVSGLTGITYNPSTNLTITITDSGLTRTAQVSYSAQVANVFSGVLGMNAMTVTGSSTANGSTPPNVNFYVLLDTSPSMAIPATQAGINTMTANTQSQVDGNTKGCAFACHEYNPAADNLGNPGGEDNYALARNLGLTLRIDEVGQAASAMVSSAISTMNSNQSTYGWTPTYQIAIDTFDTALHPLYALTSDLSTLQSNLSANPSPIQAMEVYDNNNICTATQTKTKNGVTTTTCTAWSSNSDTDTNIDATLTPLNTSSNANYIPNPGTGAKGSTPAEVLMIVTDGIEDEIVGSVTAGTADGNRQQAPFAANSNVPSTKTCAAIKARGIKIAILYTTYYPLDGGATGSWYDSYIYQFQPGGISGDQIGPDLKNNCASPGLFYQVQVGQDISAALVTLFQMALQSSHLTQ